LISYNAFQGSSDKHGRSGFHQPPNQNVYQLKYIIINTSVTILELSTITFIQNIRPQNIIDHQKIVTIQLEYQIWYFYPDSVSLIITHIDRFP